MKTKAIENLDSAQLLLDNRQFTSSVHCSYYAVFQYMKYMLATTPTRPLSYAVQDAHTGESSHEYILDEIKLRLNISPKDIRNFCEKVRLLKKDRVDADYKNRVFSDIEGLTCKSNADGIIANLKTYFGNI